MMIFALALAASTQQLASLPPFAPDEAVAQCEDEGQGDFDRQAECVTSLIRDYRQLSALYRYAKPNLRDAIDRCMAEYREDGRNDWNMTQICAHRDESLLAEVTIDTGKFDAEEASAHCRREKSGRPDVNLDDCYTNEIIGHRDFALFKAIYLDRGLQASFAICRDRWEQDGLTDWDMVSFCAKDQLDGVDRLKALRQAAP